MKKANNEKRRLNPVLAVLMSVFVSLAITAIVFLVYAAILTYTDLSEKNLQTVVCIQTAAAVGLGGFCCSGLVEKRGILWGALTGLMYAVIMIMTAYCINTDFAFSPKTLIIALISICGGGLGGIAGINILKA